MGSADLFIQAVKLGDVTAVQSSLSAEPWLADADLGGISALMLAFYYGKAEVGQIIAGARSELNLFEAVVVGDLEKVDAALEAQPDLLNAHSSDGFTALGFAAYFGRLEVAAHLLGKGADPNIASTNPLEVVPLHSALAGGHSALAILLLQAEADPDIRNSHGWTALHYCADIGDAEIAEFILDRGGDHKIRSVDGKTAAELAADVGHDHVADVILDKIVAE